jgi:hypothetical protein
MIEPGIAIISESKKYSGRNIAIITNAIGTKTSSSIVISINLDSGEDIFLSPFIY